MARSADPASIIVPAYNEADSIAGVVARIREVLVAAGVCHEIIVVDDASTDQTSAAANKAGAIVIQHDANRGYGASLKTGIRAAQYERIVITDADGTYPVEQIPKMLDELESADMVVGAGRSDGSHSSCAPPRQMDAGETGRILHGMSYTRSQLGIAGFPSRTGAVLSEHPVRTVLFYHDPHRRHVVRQLPGRLSPRRLS